MVWLAEKAALQANLQHMNQILSARRSRQLSTLQEASETTSQFEHVAYTHVDDLPFLPINTLGKGSISEVDCVVGEADDDGIPTGELARKIIHLRGSRRRQLLSVLHEEVAVMKSLVHQHIVQITETYETLTKPRQFGILMFPVGDEDLSHFLDSVPGKGYPKKDIQTLEKWLLCLASALDYVHSQGIQHKDIKPQNIICKGTEIFLTDFGQAHKLLRTSSTFGSQVEHITNIYSAPETISEGKRGRSADIFSLGCVYAEMATVITHRTVKDFHAHRIAPQPTNSKETTHLFSATQSQIKSWFEDCSWPEIYDLLKVMLSTERRPRAYEIVAGFIAATTQPTCECVHGPILLPTYWDLSIEFELLPGLVENPSPGGTFGLPMPALSSILRNSFAKKPDSPPLSIREEEEEEFFSEFQDFTLPNSQQEEVEDSISSPESLTSFLTSIEEDPMFQDVPQRRYSTKADTVSPLLDEPRTPRQADGNWTGSKRHVMFDIPNPGPPPRPPRNFCSLQPLVVEASRDEDFPEFI